MRRSPTIGSTATSGMEFLGDAVLDLIICELLYLKFPQYQEGDLTKIKSAVVSRRTCAEVANETGLTDMLDHRQGNQLPQRHAQFAGRRRLRIDRRRDLFRRRVRRREGVRHPHDGSQGGDYAPTAHQQNYKAVLQQHAQGVMAATPIYELLDEKGPDHSKCFEVCVAIDGRRFTPAWGPNKKMAEQKAALLALEDLGVLAAKEVDQAIEEIAEVKE